MGKVIKDIEKRVNPAMVSRTDTTASTLTVYMRDVKKEHMVRHDGGTLEVRTHDTMGGGISGGGVYDSDETDAVVSHVTSI